MGRPDLPARSRAGFSRAYATNQAGTVRKPDGRCPAAATRRQHGLRDWPTPPHTIDPGIRLRNLARLPDLSAGPRGSRPTACAIDPRVTGRKLDPELRARRARW